MTRPSVPVFALAGALALFLITTACADRADSAAAEAREEAPALAAQPPTVTQPGTAASGPCRLLTMAEVRGSFPDATSGVLDRSQSQHGLQTCRWDYPTGRLSLLEGSGEPQAALDEARGWALTFLDPLKPGAERQVRYEAMAGVGDEAVAVVEVEDAGKGFLQQGAYIVVTRGRRQVTVMSTDLARRDRAQALQVLKALGAGAAARLE